MSRHIDADVLSDAVIQSKNNNRHYDTVLRLSHDNEHRHFLAMIDAAPTVDVSPDTKWISVKERLPEESNINVLVYTVTGQQYVAGCYDVFGVKRFFTNAMPIIVTHWQPLPEPPKEEGENT